MYAAILAALLIVRIILAIGKRMRTGPKMKTPATSH